jgi:hypothetical protein
MTDSELLEHNEEGFIPGPGEEEPAFLARVAAAKDFFDKGRWIPRAHWDWVTEYLKRNCDVKPLYIGAEYKNQGLTPWQGAASWVGDAFTWIQLRESLRKGKYLGYQRDEILAHEAIHAVRCKFDGKYEEFFAYMTSEKAWRRVLGPIVRSPWEVWPFLSAVVMGSFWPICYLGAAIWAGIGLCRLAQGHRKLNTAAREIWSEVRDWRLARIILFRLSDDEIELFAKGANLREYAARQTSLRWQLIRTYMRNC